MDTYAQNNKQSMRPQRLKAGVDITVQKQVGGSSELQISEFQTCAVSPSKKTFKKTKTRIRKSTKITLAVVIS